MGFHSLGRLGWASCDDLDAQGMDNGAMRHVIEVVVGFSLEMMLAIAFKRCYFSDLVVDSFAYGNNGHVTAYHV